MSVLFAVLIGTTFFVVLYGRIDTELVLYGVLISFLSYELTRPQRLERFPIMVFKLFLNLPKAVYESVILILGMGKGRSLIEESVKDEWEELEKTLTITLTPKTLVIVSEEERIVVHKLGGRER